MYSHQSTYFQVLKIRLNSHTDYIYISKDAYDAFKSLSPPRPKMSAHFLRRPSRAIAPKFALSLY